MNVYYVSVPCILHNTVAYSLFYIQYPAYFIGNQNSVSFDTYADAKCNRLLTHDDTVAMSTCSNNIITGNTHSHI